MTAEPERSAPDERRVQEYLAGRLEEAEAERFEERLFADDALAAEVERALEIRAALAEAAPRRAGGGRGGRTPWLALAAAAGLATIALGVHRLRPPAPVFRGVEQSAGFDVEVEADGRELRARWAPVAGAAGYELRTLADDGRVLQRAGSEVPAATLNLGDRAAEPAFLEVVALDELGQVLRRSQRVALPD